MCLASIYADEKTEKNCVMEEAARVESLGDEVEIGTLFGERKVLHGYYINIINLMENFVLLKKKRAGHSHNHAHKHDKESVAGKLRKLLPYLRAHNRSHIEDIEKWAVKSEEAGCREAAAELKAAIQLFNEVNKHFEKALSYIDG